jgi:cysteine desulfurase
MIYADYNGSSPLVPAVKDYLRKRIESNLFANPNAIHTMGQKIYQGIEKCREIIATVVGCYPDQIIFNSGASEGVSHVLHSILEYGSPEKRIIISSRIEHAVIPKALKFYQERRGFSVKYLEVDSQGVVKTESLIKLIDENKNKIALVTVMAVNNETGVIQPFQEIQKICDAQGITYFSDTTQYIGKAEFNFKDSGLDFAICSGHKLGAISGTGFIIAKDPSKLHPLVFGSTQEHGHRGGTQNYLGIETLAVAFQYFQENKSRFAQLGAAKLAFEKDIQSSFPEAYIFGQKVPRLAGTSLISYPGIHSQAVQIELESQDIFVTTSAACSDNQPETSIVLKEMGINDQLGRGVIRVSFNNAYGETEYSLLAAALKAAYNKLGKIKSY